MNLILLCSILALGWFIGGVACGIQIERGRRRRYTLPRVVLPIFRFGSDVSHTKRGVVVEPFSERN